LEADRPLGVLDQVIVQEGDAVSVCERDQVVVGV